MMIEGPHEAHGGVHLLPSLALVVTHVAESCFCLARSNASDDRRRVFTVRASASMPPTPTDRSAQRTGADGSDGAITVVIAEGQQAALVSGSLMFRPGAVVLVDIREVHSGDADVPYNLDDGCLPTREHGRLGSDRCVLQFAPSVEWHRLCVLGEVSVSVNWVQPPCASIEQLRGNAVSGTSSEAAMHDNALLHQLTRQPGGLPIRNAMDCDDVEVLVQRHDTEAVPTQQAKVRVLSRGELCARYRSRREATSIALDALTPLTVYSVHIRGIYRLQRRDGVDVGEGAAHAVGSSCDLGGGAVPTEVFGMHATGRWFVTLAPETIGIEATSEHTVRLHKSRQCIPELALEDFTRRVCKTMLRWEAYSFDIPPVQPQLLHLRAPWSDNEHLRAQRQDEMDGIDELLDLTRAYHVIERWRKMVRQVKRERRQFRKRLSQEKLDLEASFTSAISVGNNEDGTVKVSSAQASDDAAFTKRKLEVGFLVAFQKSRREKLRASMRSTNLMERHFHMPERWAEYDVSDLPAQAMFRVSVFEPDALGNNCAAPQTAVGRSGGAGENSSGSSVRANRRTPDGLHDAANRNGGGTIVHRSSSVSTTTCRWTPIATLAVLTRAQNQSDQDAIHQQSAAYLKELLRLQVSRYVMVEHVTERSITVSWSPVDYDRVAQLVYALQSLGGGGGGHLTPAGAVSPGPGGGLGVQVHVVEPPDAAAPLRKELADCRESVKRAQQLEDKRIQFEYVLLLTPVDASTTLKTTTTNATMHALEGSGIKEGVTTNSVSVHEGSVLEEESTAAMEDGGGTGPLAVAEDAASPTTSEPSSPGGGVGSVISVFLSGCAYAPNGTPSPFASLLGANLPYSGGGGGGGPPIEERFRSYQHHHQLNNLQPNQKYVLQLAQYNVLDGAWYEPCAPILTCTTTPSVIAVADFPATGELNGSVLCVVPDGLLSQLEASTRKSVYASNILPRHAFSYTNCSTLEIKVLKLRPSSSGEAAATTVVTTRSCSVREGSKGVSFRGLELNAMFKVTCKRTTTNPSRFAAPSATAAQELLDKHSLRRSGSKLSEILSARNDAMTFTVFTVRCMPVVLANIDSTGLHVVVKKRWSREMELEAQAVAASRSSSFYESTNQLRSLSIDATLVPMNSSIAQCTSHGDEETVEGEEEEAEDDMSSPDDDPAAEYATLVQGQGIVLLSNSKDTTSTAFDPLTLARGRMRVATEGYDRIVVLACIFRCYGTNEDVALEDYDIMWPRMTVSLSLVVDWSLLPYAVKDDALEFLLSPVQCTPDLNLTVWTDESEERVAGYQEIGKHLKRLIEAREEHNAQFMGLQAEVQYIEGGPFEDDGGPRAIGDILTDKGGETPTHRKKQRRSPLTREPHQQQQQPQQSPGFRRKSFRIACSGRPVVIPNLKPNTVYATRIRPVMGGGAAGKESFGAWGPTLTLCTAAPLHLDVEGVESNSVSLHWNRESPHPGHIIAQLQTLPLPQPTHHPNFVANAVDFVCFLYRHVVFGAFCIWRREGGAPVPPVQQSPVSPALPAADAHGHEGATPSQSEWSSSVEVPEEPQPASAHHQIKDLPEGRLYFIRLQQRPATGLIGDGAASVPHRSHAHDGEGRNVSPGASSVSELEADLDSTSTMQGIVVGPDGTEDAVDADDGPPNKHGGSWSATTLCVRTVGELRAHVTPLGANRFEVIAARPGFDDARFHDTLDPLSGRPVVVVPPKVTPVILLQARVFSGYHPGRTRGLADASDDADLLPSYPTLPVDGAAYWASIQGAAVAEAAPTGSEDATPSTGVKHWADRSGLTDHRMPFYDGSKDIAVDAMHTVGSAHPHHSGRHVAYHVINLRPTDNMTYTFSNLPVGMCHQMQVRTRMYASVDKVPSTGIDIKATSGTVVTQWSQPALFVTYPCASMHVLATTETAASFAWTPPPRLDYAPPNTPALTRVDIELIAFTRGGGDDATTAAGGGGVAGGATGGSGSSGDGDMSLCDANDVPHRPRRHGITRWSATHTKRDVSALASHFVKQQAVDDADAALVASSRVSPPSPMPSTPPVNAVTVERLLPGGLGVAVVVPYFGTLRGPTSPLCVFHTVCPVAVKLIGISSNYAAVHVHRRTPLWAESLGGIDRYARTHSHRLVHIVPSALKSADTQRNIHEMREQSERSAAVEAHEEAFDVEVRLLDKEMAAVPVPSIGVVTVPGRPGDQLLCNLSPGSLYQVRGKPAAVDSTAALDSSEPQWSRALLLMSLQALSLTLLASYETRSVFRVSRRTAPDNAVPSWVRRELRETMTALVEQQEWVEVSLAAPTLTRDSDSTTSATAAISAGGDDASHSVTVTNNVRAEAVPSSVLRIAIVDDATVDVAQLSSGCTYNIVHRALPSVRGALLPDYDDGTSMTSSARAFAWRPLGTVVTCPFSPTVPALYEARGGSNLGIFWNYQPDEAHRTGALLKTLAPHREYTADQVPPEVGDTMRRGRVRSLHSTPPSDAARGIINAPLPAMASTSSLPLPQQHQPTPTIVCPAEYPLTAYSATSITFCVEAVVLGTAADGVGASEGEVRVVRTHRLGTVAEPFARLEFALRDGRLPRLLRLRVKAVATLAGARPVESEWTPSYAFDPPNVPLGPPRNLRLLRSLGNRVVLGWDGPLHAEGHNQLCFQVAMARPQGAGGGSAPWRDAVWVRGSATQCVVHGVVAKEAHRLRVVAHSSFGPVDGVASAVLCCTPFARGGGLTADEGNEESDQMLRDMITPLALAQTAYPCRIADDGAQLCHGRMLSAPSTHHAEHYAMVTRSGQVPKRTDPIRVGEDVIADVLYSDVGRPHAQHQEGATPRRVASADARKPRLPAAPQAAAGRGASAYRRPVLGVPPQASSHDWRCHHPSDGVASDTTTMPAPTAPLPPRRPSSAVPHLARTPLPAGGDREAARRKLYMEDLKRAFYS